MRCLSTPYSESPAKFTSRRGSHGEGKRIGVEDDFRRRRHPAGFSRRWARTACFSSSRKSQSSSSLMSLAANTSPIGPLISRNDRGGVARSSSSPHRSPNQRPRRRPLPGVRLGFGRDSYTITATVAGMDGSTTASTSVTVTAVPAEVMLGATTPVASEFVGNSIEAAFGITCGGGSAGNVTIDFSIDATSSMAPTRTITP